MENLKQVAQLAKKHKVKVVFDSARFAENAYFIKTREEGYGHRTIKDIVKEMYSYCDAMTMSSKKDGMVNIGGFIAMSDPDLYQSANIFNIMYEGFTTYGGMAGRDLNALAQGLMESNVFEHLNARVKQVDTLAKKLIDFDIPIIKPTGGHAVFIDALTFFPHIPRDQFPAQLLGVELYIEGGIRCTEVGTLLADRDPKTRKNRFPKMELLRLAIPRRTYTQNHMDYVAVALKNVFERRTTILKGLKILHEPPIMRHFSVVLDRL